ncbi:hypothetical protein ACHAXA_011147 [Cyclostephanos tholiformis]|uniref:Cdc23 domain-containing protein n=1 Tax=Cyclostephanos tholiformis TaxID=382380 RepID=A0ABD3SF35_9STRA
MANDGGSRQVDDGPTMGRDGREYHHPHPPREESMSLDESSIMSPSMSPTSLDATLAASASSSLLLRTPTPHRHHPPRRVATTFASTATHADASMRGGSDEGGDDDSDYYSKSMSISGILDGTPPTAPGSAALGGRRDDVGGRGTSGIWIGRDGGRSMRTTITSTNGDDAGAGGRSRGGANGNGGTSSSSSSSSSSAAAAATAAAAAATRKGASSSTIGETNRPPPRRRPSVDGADVDAHRSDVGSSWRCDRDAWDIEVARRCLRRASRECSRRGLKLASRWASEQLVGLAPPPSRSLSTAFRDDDDDDDEEEGVGTSSLSREERRVPTDVELYASSLFDLGEYGGAAHALSSPSISSSSRHDGGSSASIGQIDPPRSDLTSFGIYLRAYSLYLDGERRREERISEMRDPLERSSARNANLPMLEAELRGSFARGDLDAFGLYVYGAVLRGMRGTRAAPSPAQDAGAGYGRRGGDAAHRILVRSILMYPFNWSAWLDLGELCVNDPYIDEDVEDMLRPISDHWMYHFFCVHVFIENKANENAIVVIEKLANGNCNEIGPSSTSSGFFVQSAYLQSQLAMAYYDARDYDSAHEHFLALSEREPYRLDQMDAFSNVLYVKDQKVALSHLAHRSMTVDKYRPETCIVVGNYYSSRARHEKAVQYFQRALKLDRTYLSAWTLLGHEYIEMKNTAAAIEAYRRAVDISDREYRAWYGLGQTYEIMNMLLHALFYFRKAASLHPHDARMWCAIGGCLLGLDRRADAERSYERAVSLGDGEGIATRKLAELYREDGDEERAAKCYLRHLELRYQSQLPGAYSGASADSSPEAFETVVTNVRVDEPEAEALLYLAYYYRDNLEYDQAILCATRLEDYPGPEKEQGRGLLRDIRSRMDQQAGERFQGRSSSEFAPTRALGSKSRRSLAPPESSFEFSP